MRVTLPQAKYGEYARAVQFYESLLARLRSAGGITAVAVVTLPPFSGLDSHSNFLIEGRSTELPFPIRARTVAASPDYARTMRIRLLRGRFLAATDVETAPEIVVINETAARRFWAGDDPIGRRISFEFEKPRWLQIVGVVADVKSRGLELDAEPEAYLSYFQKDAVAGLDRDQPVGRIRAMDDLVAESVAPRRLNLWLLVAFAIVAVVLTAEGLHGVMAYIVAQRTHEIGIRLALGATRAEVLRMMLRDGATMTMTGIAIGIAGALSMARSLTALLFGISATDPLVYLAVSVALAVIALAAVAIPSSRAARVDPLAALRQG
jgi:putative ABC transport system permease protein